MRLMCPDCGAGYEVPDRLLSGRKTVRCAQCGGSWSAAPEPVVLVAEPDAVLAPPEIPVVTRPWPLWAAWAGSVGLVVTGLVLLLTQHRAIATAWPPMQRLYGAIGL